MKVKAAFRMTTMKILRTLLITSAAVVMTACATSKQPAPQIRFVGVDGEELQQVVPMGVPGPARAGQIKPGELVFHEIEAAVPMTWNRAVLVIVTTSCEGKNRRPFELALYSPDLLQRSDGVAGAMTSTPPTKDLYEAVAKLLETMRTLQMSPRVGYFHAWRDGNGQMRGEARYE